MKKRIVSWCLLVLALAALTFTGYSYSRYVSSHNVTTNLVINIEASEYTLTLDANGGAFADHAAAKNVTVAFKGTYGELPAPSRTGYLFAGWYTQKTAGEEVSSSDTVEITENTTIYAHWTAISYQILFDANGGVGAMDPIHAVYDTAAALPANGFTRTGYRFVGWNTKQDGTGTLYADEASVLNLSATNGAEVTLYAQWELEIYTVDLYSNLMYGLEDISVPVVSDSIEYTISDRAITATAIFDRYTDPKEPDDCYGYTTGRVKLEAGKTYRFTVVCDGTFGYWNANVQVFLVKDGSLDEEHFHLGETDCTFTPKDSGEYWLRMDVNHLDTTHTISHINVAEKIGSIQVTYGSDYSALYTPTREGHDFLHWADSSGMIYTGATEVTRTEDHALFAQWKADQYTIHFNANGGSGTMDSAAIGRGETFTLPENGFTRDGYEFTGWNTEADGSGVTYANQEKVRDLVPTGAVTLYAQWGNKDYQIRFDANGGSGTMAAVSTQYGKTVTLPENSFTRVGYRFIGWNIRADGSGSTYLDQAEVKDLPSADGKAVLYAQWEQMLTYTLVYDANGGTNAPAAQSAYEAKDVSSHEFTITEEIPTYISPSGVAYEFLGWSEDPALTATLQYSADGSTKEDVGLTLKTSAVVEKLGDSTTKTLYAVWGVTYRLSYDAGSGTGVPDSVEKFGRLTGCVFDVDYSVAPLWDEHDFKYWTTNIHYVAGEEQDATVMYPNPSKITISPQYSNVTLYARYYNKGALTVTYQDNVPYLGVAYNMPGDASITADVEKETVPYTINYGATPTVKKSGTGTAYQLLGWSTSPDATEVEYTVGQQVQLSRYNDQTTVLYAVWDVIPIIICMDMGDDTNIQAQATSSDGWTEEGYYWNDNCLSWAPRSSEANPGAIRAQFYLSWINSKNNRTFVGFASNENSSECDVYDRVNHTTGNITGWIGGRNFYLTERLWETKWYDSTRKAWFIPIYAVSDEFVRVTVRMYYNNPASPNSYQDVISSSYNCHVASMFESGSVSAKFIYKNGNNYESDGFHFYPRYLRDGSKYRVVGWAWEPDATVPDGQLIDSNGQTPVYSATGSAYPHLCYDREVSLNYNDTNYAVSTNSYGVTCYTYSAYVIYEEVTDVNTFKVLLDYNNGVDQVPNGGFAVAVTPNDSYTYLNGRTDDLHYDCDFSLCLDSNAYEIVGWSLSRDVLNLDLLQYPVGHEKNRSSAQEAIFVANAPFTVSTSDQYDEEEDFYYKRFYAVYAKTIHFNGNYAGTVSNMPDSVSAYTHYGFEGDIASITVPGNVPTRSEALFLGWATEADGEVVYRPGDSVPVSAAQITLYAVWQKNYDFQLVYDWNDGSGTVFSQLSYSNTVSHMEIEIISSIPARDGYKFLGWADTADATVPMYSYNGQGGTSKTITIIAAVPNKVAAKTLYAVWEPTGSAASVEDDEIVEDPAPEGVDDAVTSSVTEDTEGTAVQSCPDKGLALWTNGNQALPLKRTEEVV